MKTTIKLFLIVSMFCATAFADGNQGAGGRNCGGEGQDPCTPPCSGVCGGEFTMTQSNDEKGSIALITKIAKLYWTGL